ATLPADLFRSLEVAFLFLTLFVDHKPVLFLNGEFYRLAFSESRLRGLFFKLISHSIAFNPINEKILVGYGTAGSSTRGRDSRRFHISSEVHFHNLAVRPVTFFLLHWRSDG